jgi:hypothetical protein
MHNVKMSYEGGCQLLVICTAVQYQQVPVVRYVAQSTTTGLVDLM